MTDGVPSRSLSVETDVERVAVDRDADGRLRHVTVVAQYVVYQGERVDSNELARLRYEVDGDGTATCTRVVPLAVGDDGRTVERAGVHPNALRVAPAAERALRDVVPEVETVQPVEEAVESCVETARYALDEGFGGESE